METQLLRDPAVKPESEVIRSALGRSFAVYELFIESIAGQGYELSPEWRYYNDGKAWLCKVSYKKKTVFWLSVWDGFFKVSFFFTEKHRQAIDSLDITREIKAAFGESKPIGKLIPLTVNVDNNNQLPDLLTIIRCKKSTR